MVTELQRFPFLKRRMEEVIGNFLREGLEPSENMIAHMIEMEDALEFDKGSASKRSMKSRAIPARQANGVVVDPAARAVSDVEKIPAGNTGGSGKQHQERA